MSADFTKFEFAMRQTRDLIEVGRIVNNLVTDSLNVEDIYRMGIVNAISAFDKFIHDVVRKGIVEIWFGRRPETQSFRTMQLSIEESRMILSKNEIEQTVELAKWISKRHGHMSFQSTKNVQQALSLIWNEDHKWKKIAEKIEKPEEHVRLSIDNIVARRNQIVHEFDLILVDGSRNSVSYEEVLQHFEEIFNIARAIEACLHD